MFGSSRSHVAGILRRRFGEFVCTHVNLPGPRPRGRPCEFCCGGMASAGEGASDTVLAQSRVQDCRHEMFSKECCIQHTAATNPIVKSIKSSSPSSTVNTLVVKPGTKCCTLWVRIDRRQPAAWMSKCWIEEACEWKGKRRHNRTNFAGEIWVNAAFCLTVMLGRLLGDVYFGHSLLLWSAARRDAVFVRATFSTECNWITRIR